MFFFRKPSFEQLKDCLWGYEGTPFTYPEVGDTRGKAPSGYTIGRRRVHLGQGRSTYLQAKRCIEGWQMFPTSFVDLVWPCPPQPGRLVATLFRAPGFWTLNPCQIVYTLDDGNNRDGTPLERFGFAYGTVGDHLASGEELFFVEYDPTDESVWYEVFCFSKARHWLAKAAYPYLRIQQIRFRRFSGLAMQQAVKTISPDTVLA